MAFPESPLLSAPVAGDADLVVRARRGDEKALSTLAERFRRPAFLLALQLLGNREDALDVAQDSLLRFFTTLDRVQEERPLKPWLLAIVRNRARDLMRRQKVRRSEPIGPAADDDRPVHQIIDQRADPEADARRSELQRKLWQALGRLPASQREILVLRDYQDLSYSEIAKVLKIPIGTVMSRLHRARKSLRSLLDGDYFGSSDL